MLLVASYIFYGYWDWRFLSLIAISTIVDFTAGIKVDQENAKGELASIRKKKAWLIASICTNLGLLGFFKYFNFFIDSIGTRLALFNISVESLHLDIVLPVGISFYTFQTMSYTIDIYRGLIKPTRRPIEFALFVAYFPQLVAGPIERAKNMLPQILKKRNFDLTQFFDGIHLIFWGRFKKVFVADNLAVFVDRVFSTGNASAFEVLCGVYAFAFQIYCDFSGYSDIARGLAKCMGIEIMLNFNHPYTALNPRDFWRRWHISLSTWLRDYLYIPLGGNRHSRFKTQRNLFLTMLLGGLWHGAAWKFVLWGAYHGALLISHRFVERVFKPHSKKLGAFIHHIRTTTKMIVMFHLVCYGWLIFRGHSVQQIAQMTKNIILFKGPIDLSLLLPLVSYAGPLILIEIFQHKLKRDDLHWLPRVPAWVKSAVYACYFYLLALYGASAKTFIYFQF
jgi:D-alanyl-lipoteichoic acid acyltransferase DltB (MBOAT superfamily)